MSTSDKVSTDVPLSGGRSYSVPCRILYAASVSGRDWLRPGVAITAAVLSGTVSSVSDGWA